MSPENFTPLEIEYHEEGVAPLLARLTSYVQQNKTLVLTVSSFAVISLLAVTTVVLSNVKESQDIARAKAIEESNMRAVSAQITEKPIIPTLPPRVSVTRPPTRTPTPTKKASHTPTPTSTRTATLSPTITPTMTLYPTATPTNIPTNTPTPVITLAPTETLTPTPTLAPTETMTPTPTTHPGACVCVDSTPTEDHCSGGYQASCDSPSTCSCSPITPE